MNVMLSIWKQIVKHASKKKKPPVVLSGYSKNQDLTMFFVRIGRVFSGSWFRFLLDLDRFLSELGFGLDLWFLFGFGLIFFGLGFWTRSLVSLRIWIGYFYRIGYIKCRKTGLQVKAREHSILS